MRIVGIVFAYIALILLVVLCVKPILRKINKNKRNEKINKIQIFLTKKHVLLSILFLISFIVHVVLSMDNSFSLYTAKLSMVFLLLSVIFALLIKIKPKIFLKLHYIFSFLCLIMALLHIIEVKLF